MNNNDFFELEEDDFLEGESGPSEPIYPNAEIKIIKQEFSLFELKRQFENKQRQIIIIDPAFQRNFVWKRKQQSELIESILMVLPIPPFYFFETREGGKQVVDGRQRLTTFFNFLNGEFALQSLHILPTFNGKKFQALDGIFQSIIEDYQILTYIIQPPTPERVKYDIFDRINRGGTVLSNQEMRNALYQGKATQLLETLGKKEFFKQATEYSIKTERMKDRYVILRFIAFYMWENGMLENIDYKSDIDEFLAKVMIQINQLSEAKISELEKVFNSSMKWCYQILGSDAFRFENKSGGRKRPINMPLFEMLAFFFSHSFFLDKDTVNIPLFQGKIIELKQELNNDDSLRYSDSSNKVRSRFDTVKNIQKDLCHDKSY